MISLKSLQLSHYRSFGQTQSLILPSNGLVLVQALPFNQSASGVGKTNLFSGLNYGICCGEVKDNSKNWFSADDQKINVTVELQVDGDVWKISRSSFKTKLFINDVKLEGGAKVVNQKIRDLFKLDFDLINGLTYRRQRRRNSFVSSPDSEKKDFLSRILGLEQIDDLIKASSDTIKKIEILVEQEKLLIQNFKNELAALKPPIIINTNELDYLNIQLAKHQELLNKAKLELDTKLKEEKFLIDARNIKIALLGDVSGSKDTLRSNFLAKCLPVNQSILAYNETKGKLTALTINKPAIVQHSSILEAKRVKLLLSLCSECSRPWDKALEQAEMCSNEIHSNTSRLKEIEEAENELKVLNKDIAKLEKELAEYKDDYNKALNELNLNHQTKVALIQNEFEVNVKALKINLIKDGINDLNKLIFSHQLKIKDLNNTQNLYDHQLKTYSEKQTELQNKIKRSELDTVKLIEGQALEEDFKDLIGKKGFLGLVITEILQEISFNVNQLLAQIPNTSEISIEISPTQERETSVKPKISFVLFKRGLEIDLNALSGGQSASLEICMDLVLHQVVFNRLGIKIGWMIFDEALVGLSENDKLAVFEILKDRSTDCLFLVVEHDNDFESFFDKKIVLEFDGRFTTIQEDNL